MYTSLLMPNCSVFLLILNKIKVLRCVYWQTQWPCTFVLVSMLREVHAQSELRNWSIPCGENKLTWKSPKLCHWWCIISTALCHLVYSDLD